MDAKTKSPLVSVVIVNHDRRDDLRDAVGSVQQQDYPNVEIIVVDNASGDGSREMMAEEFPQVRLVCLDDNPGMAGYSIAFAQAAGEIVFQMDNDSLMPDGRLLGEVVRRFEEGPDDLAVVATRVEEYRAGRDQVADLQDKDARRGPIETGGFHSGGVGFRKTFLDRTRYYSREVFLYGSELFLQMQILASGGRIFFYPEILMLHCSSPVARSGQAIYYELRNRYWFMRCFSRPESRLRYLPPMLLHDLFYAVAKGHPLALVRAIVRGFAPLPEELRGLPPSNNPQMESEVVAVARQFTVVETLRRIGRWFS